MTCTCPATEAEAYALWHDLSTSEQWRRYHLRGEARFTPGEIHHPGCPLHRTREQIWQEQEAGFREFPGAMMFRRIRPFKHIPDIPRVFTGNCMVRQHTMDRHPVGPCWHSTYDGVCHLHGDVSIYLPGELTWPNDYDLEPNS